MTRVRWGILGAGLPVVLILIGLAGYTWVRRTVIILAGQSQVSYSVAFSAPPAGGRVRVSSSNGGLTVRAGTSPRIVVHGRLSGSFVRPRFSHQSTADGLILNPVCRAPAGNCSLNLDVSVPARLPVSASDSFGPLVAHGLDGRVALSDNTGDLTASRLTGTVHLADSFGTIAAARLHGTIWLANNTGDIQASGVVGDTRIQDSFGNVSVTGLAAADVVASNNTGDVTLRFTTVPRLVEVTDSFANITLVLPPGSAAYRVRARTSFGSTKVTVPESPTARHVITARNNTGSITIVRATRPAPPGAPAAPRPPGPAPSS